MRITSTQQRRDGKFMVTQVSEGGRVFRSILTSEQLHFEQEKERNAPQLTQAERQSRAIPFGQPGYVGR